MGFDLYFCWRRHERIDFSAVAAWAKGKANFAGKDDQLWYENPQTGVYFSLDFDPQGSETVENSPIPEDFFDTGLSFGLNFNRPSFFGHEAMPFVEQLANHFGLCVVDPQVDKETPVLMTKVESKELIDSWLRHNKWAILTLIEDPSFSHPLHMPITSSLYLWRYKTAKQTLERACGEEIFVPNLVPVQRKGATLVERAVTCTQGVPMIVPDSEWVFVVRGKKSFFRSKGENEVGIISTETFRELLAGYIEDFQWSEPTVRIIRPKSVGRVGKTLQSIESMVGRSELEIIGMDSFVDIELPEGT